MSPRRLLLAFVLTSMHGCGADETGVYVEECLPPTRSVGDRCLPAGVSDDGCPAGTLGRPDGSCRPAGIGAEDCAEGFVHDGDVGCEPVLPSEPCAPGLMAVPGDTVCRPVAPCAPGKWGDIPIDAGTVYVDGSYAGGMSDGTSARPWTTINDAATAAANGALLAIAEGAYAEDVLIRFKSLRLVGVCPEKVEIAGTGAELAALSIFYPIASGTEVRGLALSGGAIGLLVSGATDVVVDRVWIHDTASRGLNAQRTYGATSLSVTRSLLENTRELGLFFGTDAVVEATVVRDSLPRASDQNGGRGIAIERCEPVDGCNPPIPASVTVRSSVVERSHDVGVWVAASVATVEATVVRSTLPRASDQSNARGISISPACTPAGCDASARASVGIRSSVVEQSHEIGIFVMGADASVDNTVVRDTLPRSSDQLLGRGISAQITCFDSGCDPSARASLEVRTSVVERNHESGVDIAGSDAVLEATVVRGTLPRGADQAFGRGIHVQPTCGAGVCYPARASVTIRSSVIAQSYEIGVFVGDSDATIEGALVRDSVAGASSGLLGDGVVVMGVASATVTGSLFEHSARAGLSNFGAFVSLGATAIQCAAFDLDGEPFAGTGFSFDNRGTNGCGCPTAGGVCRAASSGLEPPEPIASAP